MKKIKKLRLINWHFFDDQEISFSDINVITGENGTGKSTILDAIHYLQSGGTCEFNSAAKTLHSSRTVENYLRARVGGEKQEFIRDSRDIIGHVVIEYDNTTTRKPFVLGCVLQLSDGRLLNPVFYTIDGESYDDNLFFTPEHEVKSFDELEKTARSMGIPLKIVGQKRQSEKARKREVFQALGISEKYETLFAKAIGFGDLGEISRFATDFLLPETKLDLSSIKDSMDAYRDIQQQVAKEKERADELKPIVINKDRYEEWTDKEVALQILMKMAQIQMAEDSIRKNETAILAQKAHCDEFSKDAQEHRKQADKEERAASEIRNSDEFSQMQKLSQNKNDLLREKEVLTKTIEQWGIKVKNESELARQIGTSLDLSGIFERKDYDAYLNTLSSYKLRLDEIRDANDSQRVVLNGDIKENRERIDELVAEIKELDANSYAFPPYVSDLKERIKETIRNKFASPSSIDPQCLSAFLEIDDPDWTDAIEGFLDKRRFDLFVSKNYFDTASKVFNDDQKLKDYFGVGVIKLGDDSYEAKKGSLAEKVSALRHNEDGSVKELKEPRQYANFLLGDVFCVNSISDFKHGQKGITKEGVYFDGKTIRYVSSEAMKKPFIGQESIKRRLKAATDEKEKLHKELKQLQNEYDSLKKIANRIGQNRASELIGVENHWKTLSSVNERLNKVMQDIRELSSINGDLVKMNATVLAHEDEAKRLRNLASDCDNKAREASEKKGSLIEQNKNYQDSIRQKNDDILRLRDGFPHKEVDIDRLLEKLANGKTGQTLYESASQLHATASNQRQIAERAIDEAIRLYCGNHPGEMIPDITNYMDFVRRYNKIVNDNLAKLQPDLDEAYQRSVSELREHFISRIRRSLNNAKETKDALNRTLRHHPFGIEEEVFEFITKKNTDPLLGGVYHIAMETNQDTVTDNLFVESMDSESQAIMDRIFEVLAKPEDDPEVEDLRREITDYRSYLNYDIRIKVSDGNDRLYSENFGAKSGGETQTPFYALIAGAFQSILSDSEKNGRSPTGLVLFDEAFNNMDGGRIKQMLEFYKELNVQLIISVPSSRLSYISPYASRIISLAKEDYMIGVYETRSQADAS